MTKILLFVLSLSVSVTATAQFSSGYQFNAPLPSMDPSFTNAHGFGMNFLVPCKKGFSAGLNFSYSNYGYQREPYSFVTMDGMLYETYLSVSNNFYQTGLTGEYMLPITFSRFQPYAGTRLNIAFFQTDLTIEDPEDETNCEPLESHILMRDITPTATLYFGFNFLLYGETSQKINERNGAGIYFFMNGGFTFGGKVNYMNVEAEPSHYFHSGVQEPDKSPYYIDFINTTTSVVHQHHAGYLYSSQLRMIEISTGFSLKF